MSLINGDQVLLSPAGSGHFVNSHKKLKVGLFWEVMSSDHNTGKVLLKTQTEPLPEFLLWVMSWR